MQMYNCLGWQAVRKEQLLNPEQKLHTNRWQGAGQQPYENWTVQVSCENSFFKNGRQPSATRRLELCHLRPPKHGEEVVEHDHNDLRHGGADDVSVLRREVALLAQAASREL